MTQEEKDLLLKVLCAILPYDVKGLALGDRVDTISVLVLGEYPWVKTTTGLVCHLDTGQFKPYLRPMSSMTEVEKEIYKSLKEDIDEDYCEIMQLPLIDWLLESHFDYRGLIPMGLALEAPEEMYNFKND